MEIMEIEKMNEANSDDETETDEEIEKILKISKSMTTLKLPHCNDLKMTSSKESLKRKISSEGPKNPKKKKIHDVVAVPNPFPNPSLPIIYLDLPEPKNEKETKKSNKFFTHKKSVFEKYNLLPVAAMIANIHQKKDVQFETFYCDQNKLWFSIDPPNKIEGKDLPDVPPKCLEDSPLPENNDYKNKEFIYVAKPGEEWNLFLVKHKFLDKIKERTKPEQMKSVVGRLSRWANVSNEGKNNRIMFKESDESKDAYNALKQLLGAVNQVFTLLKEKSIPKEFKI